MCGHIILVTSAAEVANKILTNGLLVCQKRVYAEKCKKEPTCCLKCQGWDHLSYSCMQAFNTCGMCMGHHKTASCSPGAQLRCVSCRMEGHASWSRFCPTFNCKCNELNGRLTENAMPHFPTDEPWTHIIKPLKPMLYPPPPASHHLGRPGHPLGAPRGLFWQSPLHFPHVPRWPQAAPPPANENALSDTRGRLADVSPPVNNMGGDVNGRRRSRLRDWADANGADENEDLPDISSI